MNNLFIEYLSQRTDLVSAAEYVDAIQRIVKRLEADAAFAVDEASKDPTDKVKSKIALEAAAEFLAFAEMICGGKDLLDSTAMKIMDEEDPIASMSALIEKKKKFSN